MRKSLAIGGITAAALVGGVFAAALPSVVANNFATGEATLSAPCLNTNTAVVDINSGPTYVNAGWNISGGTVNISDSDQASIQCSGHAVTLIATDSGGNELSQGTAVVGSPNGSNISLPVTLTNPVNAADVAGWAVSVD